MRVALLAAAVVGLVCATSGIAGWSAVSEGGSAAAAGAVPGGPTPVAAVPALSRTITVTWVAVPSATGYSVTRRDALGILTATGGTCTGIVAATTCTETVAIGTYRYSIAVHRGSWVGPAGPASEPVIAPGV